MTKKIRWNFSRAEAIRVLVSYEMTSFPLSISQFIKKIPNLKLMTYIEMKNQINSRSSLEVSVSWVQEHLADGSEDAALLKMTDSPDVIILYNSDIFKNSEQRIRYSIAHEIGHFFLKHAFQTLIARNGVSLSKYHVLEKEADAFAATLLMPYGTFPTDLTTNAIQKRYDVSRNAADVMLDIVDHRRYALPKIKLMRYQINRPRQYRLPRNQRSILGYSFYGFCSNCFGLTGSTSSSFCCAYCGEQLTGMLYQTDFFKIHERYGDKIMQYSEIEVDSQSRALVCPTCESDINSDTPFCMICGTFLINRCCGISKTDYIQEQFIDFNAKEYQGCSTSLPGYARFCSNCGSYSTFGFLNLLDDWEKEQQNSKNAEAFSDVPF